MHACIRAHVSACVSLVVCVVLALFMFSAHFQCSFVSGSRESIAAEHLMPKHVHLAL